MTPLEELVQLEKKLRQRDDSPMGVAAGIRLPERPPDPQVAMLDGEESSEDEEG